MNTFVEKRKRSRVEVRWPVTMIMANGSLTGEARNISVEGVFILFKNSIENLALNETYLLVMSPDGERIELMVRPVWSNPGIPAGMGLCFVEISEGDKELLQQIIEKHAEK